MGKVPYSITMVRPPPPPLQQRARDDASDTVCRCCPGCSLIYSTSSSHSRCLQWTRSTTLSINRFFFGYGTSVTASQSGEGARERVEAEFRLRSASAAHQPVFFSRGIPVLCCSFALASRPRPLPLCATGCRQLSLGRPAQFERCSLRLPGRQLGTDVSRKRERAHTRTRTPRTTRTEAERFASSLACRARSWPYSRAPASVRVCICHPPLISDYTSYANDNQWHHWSVDCPT